MPLQLLSERKEVERQNSARRASFEYFGTAIDITEQKRAEEMLRQARDKLAQFASLAELSAAVAHE
jgi:hypothetical protein